jgi:hypothetical protein
MGFFSKLFGSEIKCPACGSRARDSFSGPRCTSPDCNLYVSPGGQRAAARKDTSPPVADSSVKFSDPIVIEYTNFQDENKEFVGSRKSIRRRNAHISVRVEPTGRRIRLALDRIRNRPAVESAMPPQPDSNEARILNYHARRGSTSERYESLRQKYPEYEPD